MDKKPPDNDAQKAAESREDRLKKALKENLARRKRQARARTGAGGQRGERAG
ncbi:hypothetical protein Ga0609869_003349 [Rhodovulum iodosum]|uniref:Uncharacterized protein n=1 Tax=Rhodovulum iodosum TaxID=68291 RepID=A0ABV3XX95_9RHOB|nr:hypothetical protein [Rhodovulum robiginosum]